MKDLYFLKFYLAVGWLYAAFIVYLSLTSLPPSNLQIPQLDKLMHLGAYFALAAWFGFLLKKKSSRLIHAGLFIAMGAGLEVLQGLGGLRQAEIADALANTAGVLLAWLVFPVTGAWLSQLEGGVFKKKTLK